MGDLADDVRALGGYGAEAIRIRRIADEVEQLEQWRDAQFTGAAEPLADGRGIGIRAFGVIRDQFEQMCALLDEAGCKTDRTPEAIIAALTRLVAAERKAEQAWAAVTLMAARDEACIGVHQGAPSTMEYVDNNGNPYRSALLNYVPVHCVTAVFAVNAPANPDHLERRATLLIEAGEELLKRYEAEQVAEKAKVAQ